MNAYFDEMVLTASPIELVRLLFQRAVARVREARTHLKDHRIEERAEAINSAYRVVAELMNSIDSDAAPDLAQRLLTLYSYVQGRLLEANLKQADAPLADVPGVLTTLAEAWTEVPTPKPNPWATTGRIPDGAASFTLTA